MNILRAIVTGTIAWALIFVEWSIIMFAPILKDLPNIWQWIIHYVVLILIVSLVTHFYYLGKDRHTHGLLVGLVMLVTGIILDSVITIPLFILPQGGTYSSFFFQWLMIAGYIELLIVTVAYWKWKVKM